MTPARDQAKALLDDQEARRMAEIEEQIKMALPIDAHEPWPEYVDEPGGMLIWGAALGVGVFAILAGCLGWAVS